MRPDKPALRRWIASLDETPRRHIRDAASRIAAVKNRGGKVTVVTGSGPNLHEGVTTLIAELMRKGIVDGVITSSAVVAHEMAGTLDRVKRLHFPGEMPPGIRGGLLPRGEVFEINVLSDPQRAELAQEIGEGWDLYDRLTAIPGECILKAAGNMAWPMGLRTELLALEAEQLARASETTVEFIAGHGADERTMIGAGARLGIPVVVSTPQLIGGGDVGLAIGDAISISRRARLVADLLAQSDVIVESAIALSQEIHDGPFELYTGHGIWSAWRGLSTYSLRDKALVRIDLDRNLELAWRQERETAEIQMAVDLGLPKTKITGIPFRMEMSGFARLEGSLPVTADIGIAWPCLAAELEQALDVELDFISAPQETPEGRAMREWIAGEIRYVDRDRMIRGAGPGPDPKSSPL